ncbi:MAG: hypothetical protein KJO07_24830 [Deltaproteobacteria bacterium]|nr:hypothetical protein [Deltaproteobacteria bacterium]
MMDLLKDNIVVIMTLIVMAGLWLALRTSATEFAPGSSLDGILGQGEPVLLEFFGNT